MSKKGGGNEAALARKDEQERQARIRKGTRSINRTFDSQFTNDYYDQQRQRYLTYATPQLADQYTEAQKQLAFALDRAGALDSSARAQKTAELTKLYGVKNQQVADQALSYQTQAKNNVEDARANLISALNASGDADQAAKSAITRASALSQPASAYSPLTQLFADFTGTLNAQQAAARAYEATNGAYGSPGVGLFGGSRGSTSVRY